MNHQQLVRAGQARILASSTTISSGARRPIDQIGQRWIAGRDDYFLPVRVVGQMFRGKFLAGLKAAYAAGQLRRLPGAGSIGLIWTNIRDERLGAPSVQYRTILARRTHLIFSEVRHDNID